MTRAAFFCNYGPNDPDFNRVFGPRFKARVQAQAELLPHVITRANFDEHVSELRKVNAIFATWGMWDLSPAQLAILSNLKAVFYAAGSVKDFAESLLECGIVTSSWVANAIPVAEFTLGQILLANKGYFRNVREFGERPEYGVFRGRGNYGATVSVLGAGQIGRKLIELLRPFHLRVLVFDPFLSSEAADALGVLKVDTVAEAFRCGDIVSNHLADVPATINLICDELFALMPPNSTFINTGRGGTVNHEHLVTFLQTRPDVTALLDVTEPEPLPRCHPLRALPNVSISGHIAGSIGDEIQRMGEFALEEFERWQAGKALRYAITPEMLETSA